MRRRALVTGGGSGIGAATVARLVRDGAAVTVVEQHLSPTSRLPPAVEIVVGDVADEQVMRQAVERASGDDGTLDLLHLNAGRAGVGPIKPWTDLTEVRAVIDTNLLGVLNGLITALPALQAARGAVVVTSSLAGLVSSPADPLYAATKHALVGLVRSCAPTLTAAGVRINAICPSLVATPLVPGAPALQAHGVPVLSAEDVAQAVLALTDTDLTGVVRLLEQRRSPTDVTEPQLSALQPSTTTTPNER